MVSCPTNGIVATVSVDVADPDGDRLAVVWTVDGTAYQTNNVAASGPPTTAHVDFMAAFGQGIHDIGVSVTDAKGCEATCSTTLTVVVVPEKDDT